MSGSEIQGNSIENSRYNINKPTWENYDKYLKNYYDAKSLAVFLTKNPAHVKEWFEILNKEVSQFKVDNFDNNLIEEDKIITYKDWKNIKIQLRKQVMWCYYYSLDFKKMEGREIANLLIYLVYFVLNPGERPKRENFSYMQLRKDCQFTFKSHQIMKKELPHNPAELNKEKILYVRPPVTTKIADRRKPLPNDYKEIKGECTNYLPWKYAVINNFTYNDLIEKLRKEYIFSGLPTTYFYQPSRLPLNTDAVTIPNHIKLSICDKKNIRILVEYLRPLYTFITKDLSKQWIDVLEDNREILPEDIDSVNRKAGVQLPINRADLKETVDKIRVHYKFKWIPSTWIKEKYEGKEILPSVDTVITEMAKKTEEVMVLPITDRVKASNTIKLLHKFYNFKYLSNEFFRIPAIANPVFRRLGRHYKESNKGGYGPTKDNNNKETTRDTTNKFRIATQNICGFSDPAKQNQWVQACIEEEFDIIGLTETKIKPRQEKVVSRNLKRVLGPDNNSIYESFWSLSEQSQDAGIGIMIKETLAKHVFKIEKMEGYALGVEFAFKNSIKLNVLVIYYLAGQQKRTLRLKLTQWVLKRIHNGLDPNYFQLIIGDFNAVVNPSIDRSRINLTQHRGSMAETTMLRHLQNYNCIDSFRACNNRQVGFTWFCRGDSHIKSRIDMIWISSNLLEALEDTKVKNKELEARSDHKCIITMSEQVDRRNIYVAKNVKEKAWVKFGEMVDNRLDKSNFSNRRTVEKQWNIIKETIFEAASKTIPKKRVVSNKKGADQFISPNDISYRLMNGNLRGNSLECKFGRNEVLVAGHKKKISHFSKDLQVKKRIINNMLSRNKRTIISDSVIINEHGNSTLVSDPEEVKSHITSSFEKWIRKREITIDELNEFWYNVFKPKNKIDQQ
ncbi:hypothetical protein Glove_235g11 [Diversispora epigaea]|uniref:Endonuclease/exonuclease/phosphatase domain-containing protein n=1 Tax=Diversispora epigaea TaxID=1348612 RepID=A0A397II37_9GLOM|nr:hypothetical protein Glove_235g11 [Diversispora epigaea]